MLGLVVLLVMFGYLAIAVTATVSTVRSVKRAGGDRREQWKRGGLVVLIFYLIPFWDAIPTWAVFFYKCQTEAVVEVRKTAEVWSRENASILDQLRPPENTFGSIAVEGGWRYFLNQRIAIDEKDTGPDFLSVQRIQSSVVDTLSGEVLLKFVDFRSGARFGSDTFVGLKFWLRQGSCKEGDESGSHRFYVLAGEYRSIARKQD